MTSSRKRFYYGWTVLGAVSGINFANSATSIGVLTIFILPLTSEFGWTRTEISVATSIGAVLGAILAPFAGRITDRFGAKAPLLAGAILIVAAMIGLATMQSLIWFYIAFSMARLSDQGLVQAPSPPAVAKWFSLYRGRAMSILFLMSSLGGVGLPLAVQAVIATQGWREAWILLGIVMLVVGLIPVALFVRRQPEDMGLPIDGIRTSSQSAKPSSSVSPSDTSVDEVSLTLGQAIRSPALWLIAIAVFFVGTTSTGISLHLVPFFVSRGIDTTAAVGAVSVNFLTAAIGTLFWGYLADKWSPKWLLVITLTVRTLGLLMLISADTVAEAFGFSVVQGFTEAGLRTLLVVMLAAQFGRSNLGTIFGITRSTQVAGFAIGPLISGAVFDATGDYFRAFGSFMVLGAISIVLVALARQKVTVGVEESSN